MSQRNLKNFLALAPYRHLKKAKEAGVALVAVMEKKTGYLGNATVCRNGKVALYYGASDGSDDRVLSPKSFGKYFRIVALCPTESDYDSLCLRLNK